MKRAIKPLTRDFVLQRLVEDIRKQNTQADDLMEKQEEIIATYKDRMEEAVEKIKDKLGAQSRSVIVAYIHTYCTKARRPEQGSLA
jgi:preprotein translocase subunit SecA